MKRKVKEVMIETSAFAVIDQDSTLFEAILTIGATNLGGESNGSSCPAALVSDGDKVIKGYLNFRNLLKSLEPKYSEIIDTVEEEGLSPEWIRAELKKSGLWADALDDICKKAGEMAIRDLMTVPEERQITTVDASLNEALFQMMATGYDYLFVREGAKLAGIISLSAIIRQVCDAVKNCRA